MKVLLRMVDCGRADSSRATDRRDLKCWRVDSMATDKRYSKWGHVNSRSKG